MSSSAINEWMRSFIGVIWAVVASWWAMTAFNTSAGDLVADWLAIQAITDGIDPYMPLVELANRYGTDLWQVTFAAPRTPGHLLLDMPLALVSLDAVPTVGFMQTIIGGLWCMWIVARIRNIAYWKTVVWLPFLLIGLPGAGAIAGQPSFWVAGLIGWTFLAKTDSWTAGVPLGVAVTIKLYPWLLVPVLWMTGRRKAAYGATAAFGALNLAGLALPGTSLTGAISALSGGQQFLEDYRNGSALALFDLPVWVGVAVGVLFVLAVSRMEWERAYMLAVPVSLLVAPIVWNAYLPTLLIPLAVAPPITLSAIAILWAPWHLVWLNRWWVARGDLTFLSLVVLTVLVAYRSEAPMPTDTRTRPTMRI